MRTQSNPTPAFPAEIIPFSEKSYRQDNGMQHHLVPLLPPVDKPDRIFKVYGDEMSPEIPVGSWVGAKRIKLPTPFIAWGEVYLIDTLNYGTLMRRVNTSNLPGCICCHASQKRYEPLDLPIDSILNIYKINMIVTLV